MPQITSAIGEREPEAKIVAHIKKAANELVGRYNLMKHNAYQGLWHRWLNRIFELVGILYQPRSKLVV
jgi:hypothetical protein